MRPGLVYDAPIILGLGPASSEPLPEAAPGEVIVRVGPWAYRDLLAFGIPNRLMVDDGMGETAHVNVPLAPDVYRLRLVPESGALEAWQQKELLLPDENFPPVTIAAAALVCHLRDRHEDYLSGVTIRCDEQFDSEQSAALRVVKGGIYLVLWHDIARHTKLHAMGCRKA